MKSLLPLAILCGLLLFNANAAQAELGTDAIIIGTEPVRTRAMAWGDWDGDGDLDLAVGAQDAHNYVLENTPDGLLLDPANGFGWRSDTSKNTRSVAWGDWDNDGDLDLAVGNEDSADQLFENVGGDLVEHPWANAAGTGTQSVAWGDWDGDGDLDLAVGQAFAFGVGAENFVYENDGGALHLDPNPDPDQGLGWVSSDQRATYSVAWGDWDGDGDLDLAAGNWQENVIYENDGSTLLVDASQALGWVSAEKQATTSIDWGDWDNDGDLDLAVGNSALNIITPEPNQLYENNAGSMTLAWSSTEADLTTAVRWGDWDHDGDLDLAVGNSGPPNLIYDNSGGQLSLAWTSPHQKTDTFALAWADWDNDGDLDLATGNASTFFDSAEQDRLILNHGGGLGARQITVEGNNHTWATAWGDADNDGDLDLAVAKTDLSLSGLGAKSQVYTNQNGQLVPMWEASQKLPTNDIAWGDFDSDGDLDLLLGNWRAKNHLYLNQGGQLQPEPFWTSNESSPSNAVAWGDFDGDGDLDLAVANGGAEEIPDGLIAAAHNEVYENVDGVLTLDPEKCVGWQSPNEYDSQSIAWGDWDNDGDLDLAVGNAGSSSQVFLNTGDCTEPFALVWESLRNADETRSVAWGDWDGDGDLDLAVGNWKQETLVYENVFTVGERTLQLDPEEGLGWRSGDSLAQTNSVAWGDWDNDGDLDLAVANETDPQTVDGETILRNDPSQIYENEGGTLRLVWLADGVQNATTKDLAWGDVDGDGDLDLALGNKSETDQILLNGSQGSAHLAQNPPKVSFTDFGQNGQVPQSEGYGSATILSGAVIPIRFTLTDPISHSVGSLALFYSLNGGGHWQPAQLTPESLTTNLVTSPEGVLHQIGWDLAASGFYGKSDNVQLRLVVNTQPQTDAAGDFRYANQISHSYQRSVIRDLSTPLRIRGIQTRVLAENGQPAEGAMVLHAPPEKSPRGRLQPLQDDILNQNYKTDKDGYLRGRSQINIGDRLMAMWPITATATYTLYHTSPPFPVNQAGTQELQVASSNPLLLFDLAVALDWDARADLEYLDQLENDLHQVSNGLYQISGGQAMLGKIEIFHGDSSVADSDDANPLQYADVVIRATNAQRPSAVRGGIVDQPQPDIDKVGEPIMHAAIPGQVRMPSRWNRYGDPAQGQIGFDWPRTLLHELGHYIFHLPDNYLGISKTSDLLKIVDCKGSIMTDPYLLAYNHFLAQEQWTGECEQTLAAEYLGRTDWQTILQNYPALFERVNADSASPAITTITFNQPSIEPAHTRFPVVLKDAQGNDLAASSRHLQGYLIQTNDTPGDPADDQILELGSPIANALQVRGGRNGDLLCINGTYQDKFSANCTELTDTSESLRIAPLAWEPQITTRAVNTTTLEVSVTGIDADTIYVQVLPAFGEPSTPQELSVTGQGSDATVAIFTFERGAFYGHVRIWTTEEMVDEEMVDEEPFVQLITEYQHISSWNAKAYAWWAKAYAWGAKAYAWGAPVMANDGQFSIFPLDDPFGAPPKLALQKRSSQPHIPSWTSLIGQAYQVQVETPSSKNAVLFQYLGADLPQGVLEENLSIYYRPADGITWQRLNTEVDAPRNMAVAALSGSGIYALLTTRPAPTLPAGCHRIGYPVQQSLPVATALASIHGQYTIVYAVDAGGIERFYDPKVASPFNTLVNTLETLDFGHAYDIYLESEAVIYWPSDESEAASDFVQSAGRHQSTQMPATYYGWVAASDGFTPTIGMKMTAFVDEQPRGETSVQEIEGKMAYVIHVQNTDASCGSSAKIVEFVIDGIRMPVSVKWDNSGDRQVDLALVSGESRPQLFIPFIMR